MRRPRARSKPVEVPDLEALVEKIEHAKFVYGTPAAVCIGRREWTLARRLYGFRQLVRSWPGGEETLADVPVVVRAGLGAPRILQTQEDMEEALLEGHR